MISSILRRLRLRWKESWKRHPDSYFARINNGLVVSKKGFEVLHPSYTSQKKQYFSQWMMTEKERNYQYLFIAQFHWALSVLLIHAMSITNRMLLQFTFQTTCTIWKKMADICYTVLDKKNILVFKTSAILIIITIRLCFCFFFAFQRLQLYMLFHLLSPCTSTPHIYCQVWGICLKTKI